MVTKLSIILIMSLLTYCPALSQQKVTYDSSDIEVRHLPFKQIKSYSEQKDFDYRENSVKAVSLWDRFWSWFWEQFYRMSRKETVQKGFEIFIWAFSISMVLFAIYRLTGMERRFFFQRSDGGRLNYHEELEDIHAIDFEKAIEEAIANKQYRIAIRLMYLKNIKTLSDRHLIDYRPDKTNFDYARELTNVDHANGFKDVTLVYEYAWYGEFPIEREGFEQLREIFSAYEKTIRP